MEKQGIAGFWLSPQQNYVWSLQQEGTDAPYIAAAFVLLEGPLQPEKLLGALRGVVSRHEILRTVFHRRPGMKVPFQVILEATEPAWESLDLGGLDEAAQQNELEAVFRREQAYPFNLQDGPVLHATLANLGKESAALILSIPAVCGDSQSLQNLAREISLIYAGAQKQSTNERLRYVQFAQWQNDLLESDDENAQEGRNFWSKQSARDLLVTALPQETKRSGTAGFR